jgi:hypothetical protein
VVPVPLDVQLDGDTFTLHASCSLGDLYPAGQDPAGRARLRLRVVWNNSAWETVVRRTSGSDAGIEVSFAEDGELSLTRHGAAAVQPSTGAGSR